MCSRIMPRIDRSASLFMNGTTELSGIVRSSTRSTRLTSAVRASKRCSQASETKPDNFSKAAGTSASLLEQEVLSTGAKSNSDKFAETARRVSEEFKRYVEGLVEQSKIAEFVLSDFVDFQRDAIEAVENYYQVYEAGKVLRLYAGVPLAEPTREELGMSVRMIRT